MSDASTLFDKIWQRHVVVDRGDGYHLLYVDRHLMHDGSAAGFARLRQRGQTVRRPDLAFANHCAASGHWTSSAPACGYSSPWPEPWRCAGGRAGCMG